MPPDASVDAAMDAPVDAGPPPNTVIGRSFTRCHQVGGDVEVPDNLTFAVIEALVPDSEPTGYRVVAGRGKADGSFTIEGVPDGVTYLLHYGPADTIPAYYVTARHEISIFAEVSGRCVPAPVNASAPTPIKFQLTGMTPFAAGPGVVRRRLDGICAAAGVDLAALDLDVKGGVGSHRGLVLSSSTSIPSSSTASSWTSIATLATPSATRAGNVKVPRSSRLCTIVNPPRVHRINLTYAAS
jgi:hypothetical protein